MNTYPPELPLTPAAGPVVATVSVPGSKSVTNRALVLAALGDGCTLRGALRGDDTEVMIDCLRRLGWVVDVDWPAERVAVRRPAGAGLVPADAADLFVGNSGTTVRFVAALLALGRGVYRLDGVPRMRQRPIEDLLAALRQLGADAASDAGTGCPPATIRAGGWPGGRVRVRAEASSQFLSGLLLAAPFGSGETVIEVDGVLVSEPYVAMTLRMLDRFGLAAVEEEPGVYRVPGGQRSHLAAYEVEPDASSASYFLAAAAVTGGRMTVAGLGRGDVLQGDVRFADVLGEMGCRVERCDGGLTVHGRPLRGIDADMNDISDTVMTLGAVACFAAGPTTIRNVAHVRHKETDRLAALATELRRLGAGVEEFADGLRIEPRPLRGAAVATYDDHRMAMSLAVVGLRVPGVVVENPACVAKTYPGFWDDWRKL